MIHFPRIAYHRGITMHKLPVGGDVMGGLFALAVILIVLFAIPLAPWFLFAVLVLGLIMSVLFIHWHRRHKIEIDDLSALTESREKTPKI